MFQKNTFVILLVASLFLSACSQTPQSPEATTAEATAAAVTERQPIQYPDDINFDDTETLNLIFDVSEITEGVITTLKPNQKSIVQQATIHGTTFTLTIGLSDWNGHTTPEQITTCAKLFWYCYPQMYARFAHSDTPVSVKLNFEDSGYEVASASGDAVHIHDQWLADHPNDFDCLTHEFAHVIQGGWNGGNCPTFEGDTYMIERFADYCRFIYAYQNGRYNDNSWTLQTAQTENTYYKSVRFWTWLDYTYSSESIDIMNRIAQAVHTGGRKYTNTTWKPSGSAWQEVFEGTEAAGKTIDDLWEIFAQTELSQLSSTAARPGSTSPLLKKYPIRETIKNRFPAANDYLTVK